MSSSCILVVARYTEDVSWTSKVSIPVRIYNKGEFLQGTYPLPNIGREAHTYLHYIVETYENLPDLVCFTQGNPFDHSPRFLEVLESVCSIQKEIKNPQPLSHRLVESLIHSPSYHIDINKPTKELFNFLKIPCLDTFVFSVGALVAIPKTTLLKYPKYMWKNLLHGVQESETKGPCCKTPGHSARCTCLNSFSPWAFERVWLSL